MISIDQSKGYLAFTSPVTLSYQSRTGNGTYPAGGATYADAVVVDYCERTSVTKEDKITDPALLATGSTAFHLWTANLAGITPKKGDLITDNLGLLYVVLLVAECDQDDNGIQRYRCSCIQSTQ